MNTFFVILLLILMLMVVVSLVRGVVAFLKTTRLDIDRGGDGNRRELQLRQNRMMFARVKFQALAVVVVFVLLLMAR